MEPCFRRRADGSLNLTDTIEAAKVKESNKGKPWTRPMSPEGVLDKARNALIQHHGDPSNRKHLLGFFEIQFGVYRGQTFRWLAENALGYAAYLVAAMKRDPTGGSKDSQDHAHNKECFREYIELFPSGRIAIAMKEEQYAERTPKHAATTQLSPPTQQVATTQLAAPTELVATTQLSPTPKHAATSSLRSLLVRRLPDQNILSKSVQRLVSPFKAKPSLTRAHTRPSPTLTNPTVSTEAAAGPSATLTNPTVSTEAAAGPSATLTNPTVSTEAAAGPSATITNPTVSTEVTTGPSATLTSLFASAELDDSTLLAEAIRYEEAQEAHVARMYLLIENIQNNINYCKVCWSVSGTGPDHLTKQNII
ncbi:adhesion G-protein coupled receptor G4-like [Trachinotus anak]|uniref:adhesion G-protein coupled receptor G4-like n=1 Tax=Trachinotus anak TaxID=443729 RepID=UPI0039F2279F